MSERKTIKIDKLRVWSDNPRYGFIENKQDVMDEVDAINLLIDTVGEKKMSNLATDIIKAGGLNGNVLPTVVENNGLFYVYDGNRRISSIKMILNTELIDSSYSYLKDKINEAKANVNLSFLEEVFVYITTKEEALALMDKTHSGEQDGIGVIKWDAFNRDISLKKRNQSLKYGISFKVARLLDWKTKKDFKIPYTDFQRLFGSNALLNTFDIRSFSESEKEKVVNAVEALLCFKTERGFSSFSRQFNIIESGSEDDSKKPIDDFIDWWKQKQKTEAEFMIEVDTTTVFSDSVYSFDRNTIHIKKKAEPKDYIAFDKKELTINFYDPAGKRKKDIDIRIGGRWTINVFYKGISGNGSVIVKTPSSSPTILFNNEKMKVKRGESLNLNSLILSAKSIHDNKMGLISVSSVGSKEAIIGDKNIFSSQNDIGTYQLSFKFDNDGEEYALIRDIIVFSGLKPALNDSKDLPFSFEGNRSITFSSDVSKLIEEINELWETGKYKHVICCAARSVAELSILRIDSLNPNILNNEKDLKKQLERIADYFLDESNHQLSAVCNKMHIKHDHTKNLFQQLKDNAQNVAAALHLGAHRSASALDSENLYDKMHIYLTLLVQCSEGLYLLL